MKLDEGNILCEVCGERIEETINNKKYCDKCAKEKEKERQRKKWHKYKEKYRSATYANETCNH